MIKRIANKCLHNFKPYEPGKPIDEVSRELGIKNIIKMASNENPFGPSPKALSAMKKALSKMHRYPDGACYYLKKRLSGMIGLSDSNIAFGNGSNELVEMIFNAFVRKGDQIIASEHAFVVYRLISRQRGIRLCEVPMKDHTHDLPAMARAITRRTKVVFVANPNNPTGTMNTSAEVDAFIRKIPAGALLVLDEAYREYVTRKDYPRSVEYLKGNKNIIILRTFSKIYGLAGLRIGYAIARRDIIGYLELSRQPFNVNAMAQEAALAALGDRDYISKVVRLNNEGRISLQKDFTKMGLSYVPSQANFILVCVNKKGRKVFEGLMQRGIIVRPMDEYGYQDWIRVTVGTKPENKRLIAGLRDVLKIDRV